MGAGWVLPQGDSGVAGLRACQQARGKGQAHMTVLRAGAGLPGNAALHPANQTRTRIKLNSTKCNINQASPTAAQLQSQLLHPNRPTPSAGRLSQEEIDRMVNEAEEFAEQVGAGQDHNS